MISEYRTIIKVLAVLIILLAINNIYLRVMLETIKRIYQYVREDSE